MNITGKSLLIGSLLLNALLVGLILGNLRGEVQERRAHAAVVQLPANLALIVKAALHEEQMAISDAMRAAATAQEAAATTMRADPMVLDKLDSELAQVRTHQDVALAAYHHALESAAAKLNPKDRDSVANAIENGPPAGPGFLPFYRWSYLGRLLG